MSKDDRTASRPASELVRTEFPRKSHSKRKKIFIDRAEKLATPLLREFHRKHQLNTSETEIRAMALRYADRVAETIRRDPTIIFNDAPRERSTDEEHVRKLIEKIRTAGTTVE